MMCRPRDNFSRESLIIGYRNRKIGALASLSLTKFQTEFSTATRARTEKTFTIAEQNHEMITQYSLEHCNILSQRIIGAVPPVFSAYGTVMYGLAGNIRYQFVIQNSNTFFIFDDR